MVRGTEQLRSAEPPDADGGAGAERLSSGAGRVGRRRRRRPVIAQGGQERRPAGRFRLFRRRRRRAAVAAVVVLIDGVPVGGDPPPPVDAAIGQPAVVRQLSGGESIRIEKKRK